MEYEWNIYPLVIQTWLAGTSLINAGFSANIIEPINKWLIFSKPCLTSGRQRAKQRDWPQHCNRAFFIGNVVF